MNAGSTEIHDGAADGRGDSAGEAPSHAGSTVELERENSRLRIRLAEAEQTLQAIRAGEVDSLVIEAPDGLRVYALEGASNTYRVLIEAMNEGAATLTETGLILYCNSRFARLFDLPLQHVMGRSIRDRVAERFRATLDGLLRSAESHESRAEIGLLGARGDEVPAYLSVNAVEADGRKLMCLVAVDLRPQKRTEEILAAERLASSVIEQAAQATLVCDESGRIVRASASAAELSACNPLLARFEEAFPLVLFCDGPQRHRLDLLGAVLGGQTFRAATGVLSRRDGSDRELLVSAAPLQGALGRIIGGVVTLVDVTESRRAQAALRESERALRESMGRLELLARVTAVLTEGNLDARALLDKLVAELVPTHGQVAAAALFSADGSGFECAAWLHAEPDAQTSLDAALTQATLAELGSSSHSAVGAGQPLLWTPSSEEVLAASSSAELRAHLLKHPFGSLLLVPLRTARGVTGVLAAGRPVGAAPFSATALALLQDIADRAALALEATLRYAEARRAIRVRDDFLSIASHELRTPLTALQLQLQGMAHLLTKGEDADPTKFARKLEMANRQTRRLGALVDELLDVSRLTLGKLELHREAVDLGELASEIVERHAFQAQAAGCDLDVQAKAVVGIWDRLRLEQVLTNLVTNAVKYGANQPVLVRVEAKGAIAELSVRDHGMGIRAQDLERIFGPFERAVSVRNYGGLGLGLYISLQIVKAHGGTIDVQSDPGRGAMFRVLLPITPDAGAAELSSEQKQ